MKLEVDKKELQEGLEEETMDCEYVKSIIDTFNSPRRLIGKKGGAFEKAESSWMKVMSFQKEDPGGCLLLQYTEMQREGLVYEAKTESPTHAEFVSIQY